MIVTEIKITGEKCDLRIKRGSVENSVVIFTRENMMEEQQLDCLFIDNSNIYQIASRLQFAADGFASCTGDIEEYRIMLEMFSS